jgi:hypothetical protein
MFFRVLIDRVPHLICNLKSLKQCQELCSNLLSRKSMDSTQEVGYRQMSLIQEVIVISNKIFDWIWFKKATTAYNRPSMMANRLLPNSFSSSKDKELETSQSRTNRNEILFKMKINLSSLINSKRYRGRLSIRRVISRSSYQRIWALL